MIDFNTIQTGARCDARGGHRRDRTDGTLAKKQAGRDGVFDLAVQSDLDAVLASVEVGDIWGIGRQSATWLEGQGIRTARDLKHADAKAIRARLTVVGERIVYELRGISCQNNARSETMRKLPTFRDAWKNGQRCLIPGVAFAFVARGRPVPLAGQYATLNVGLSSGLVLRWS